MLFKAELPPYYKPWMEIALQVPELVNSKELRLRIDKVFSNDPLVGMRYK